jgi:hypothetical protein
MYLVRNSEITIPQKILKFFIHLQPYWRDGRVVEGARLESVYTSKGYPGFESQSLRQENPCKAGIFFYVELQRRFILFLHLNKKFY